MSNSNVSKASQPPTQKKQLKRKRSVDNTANSSRPSKKTKRSKGGNTKAKATPKPKPAPKPHPQDPSTSYLASPLSAPIVEEAKSFFRSLCGQKFQFNVSVGATTGWRTQGKWAPPQIGLFLPKSHNVIPARDCPVHHPSINEALAHIEEAASKTKVEGYNESLLQGEHKAQRRTGTGHLRYIHLMVERKTKKVQLTLVWNAGSLRDSTPHLQKLVDFLVKKDTLYHSIWVNFNKGDIHENAIFSRDPNSWHKFFGPDTVSETLKLKHKPELYFGPNVFRQANLEEFPKIITRIRGYVPNGCKLLELYGGVGTIGLHLLDLISDYVCSDENPNNFACFMRSVEQLPEFLRTKVQPYEMKSATEMAHLNKEFCIVDPPRKGLDQEVIDVLLDTSPTYSGPIRLVYVSCGFKALERDLQVLGTKWKILHAEGFVLFPGSNHIETLVVMDRKK